MPTTADTICAVATPAGRGGISIVRVSGSLAADCAKTITGRSPQPRHAHYGSFLAASGTALDAGITLFFPGPDSFTGEDVVEFHAHGGPFVVDLLLQEILRLGTRLARPGEFTERAFLNDKIDLAQAEAIADLINSSSAEAARFAMRSMQGEFSRLVDALVLAIIDLRKYVEAAMDFPDEDVDFLEEGEVQQRLQSIVSRLDAVLVQARQGTIMQEGLTVVIAGAPNAGKSSLLNALSGQPRAIVTDIAGTTRDTLRESISIDGMPLHIIDTAGLHVSDNVVEQEGIRRAWQAIQDADLVLLVNDSAGINDSACLALCQEISAALDDPGKLFLVQNKCDLSGHAPGVEAGKYTSLWLSAKTGAGLDGLRQAIRTFAGLETTAEGGFIARRRHLDALLRARDCLENGHAQLSTHASGELLAEDLKQAHQALETITGAFSADDLLGEIFASFCIGK